MDLSSDTLSAASTTQWVLPFTPSHHGHDRTVPLSSLQLRRDPSETSLSLSQRTPAFHSLSTSRLISRRLHRPATSIGTYPSTLPSQPVIVRVHSADASAHLDPEPRPPHTGYSMRRRNELPPVSDFSIEGILAAIQPEIDGTIDAIAEIMGRSRLALANEYDSHMPPQGEIRASSRPPLLPVEEASSSNERLAADNVLIVGDEASLIDGSHSGSAAYDLLERLRSAPRSMRRRNEASVPWGAGVSTPPPRTPSTAVVTHPASPPYTFSDEPAGRSPTAPRLLLKSGGNLAQPTHAVVAETYLLASANGLPTSNPPIVSESGHNYPLYSYDEADLFEAVASEPIPPGRLRIFQSRMQNLMLVNDLEGLTAWLHPEASGTGGAGLHDAEWWLRDILARHHVQPAVLDPEADEDELYD